MLLVFTILSLISLVFGFPTTLATFSDDMARNKMFPLAAAAFSSTPQACLTNKFTNAQLYRQVNVNCSGQDCSGYSAVLHTEQTIVLSFRGTRGFLQLFDEASQSVFTPLIPWIAGGKVSKYFAEAFSVIWNGGMKEDFADLINTYPSYKIWVTGHSLGGAMASLAASYIVANQSISGNNVQLITFGQPRTGNVEWANAHDDQLPYSFRVTHYQDMVPHVPQQGLLGYQHHKSEVWYNDPMTNYTVCADVQESNKCSNSLLITASLDDHRNYFGKFVSQWGAAGCT